MDKISSTIIFLTKDPLGLIILSIMSSIIGAILYNLILRTYHYIIKKYKRKKFTNYLIKVATGYVYGYRASYVRFGTMTQNVVWGADYIITSLIHISIIIISLILLCVFLILLPSILDWIPIVIISILIAFRYKILKRHLNYFNMTVDNVFGEEYLKKEKEGYMGYWDSICNKDNNQEENSNGKSNL